MKLRPTQFVPVLLFLFVSTFLKASNNSIDLAANSYNTVTLFFPSTIKKVIKPASNFLFEYDANTNIGILKARKGAPSNLTVITNAGFIYSFTLRYTEKVKNFTYLLLQEQAIGTLKTGMENISLDPKSSEQLTSSRGIIGGKKTRDNPENIEAKTNDDIDPVNAMEVNKEKIGHSRSRNLYEGNKEDYYNIFCENNYLQKSNFKNRASSVSQVTLMLKNLIADREELYYVFELTNDSNTEFHVKDFDLFLYSPDTESRQRLESNYVYNASETVAPNSSNRFVYVSKNFQLGSTQKLYVKLEEVAGERRILLSLQAKIINAR